MRSTRIIVVAALVAFAAAVGSGQGMQGGLNSDVFKSISLRSVGPSYTTGRIQDVEVDPKNPSIYYAVSAAGGVWKSTNRGSSWTPIFDGGDSFNMCCLVIDPKNSDVLWLGTGENSNPRSAMIGSGLYKSTDAGATWTRVGLAKSEHIGNLKIDPRNSDVVYVAAQGPLWSAGGDRGVFKTIDGGKTWDLVLKAGTGEDTGANEVVIDPNNPDVLYASMWQRRRGVGQMIGGGPEGGIFKSTNAGKTWAKLTNGLPTGDVGRIALGVDPKAKPTRIYALLNGLQGESGFYRSNDAGATWDRMGAPFGKPGTPDNAQPCAVETGRRGGGGGAAVPPVPTRAGGAAQTATPPAGGAGAGATGGRQGGRGAQGGGAGGAGVPGAPATGEPAAPRSYSGGDPGYYQEIIVDPLRPDTIWSVNTNLEWSRDGGRCWGAAPVGGGVHVDYHDVWQDPKDIAHTLVANDGGLYETWDEGRSYRHFQNIPVTQFYRVGVDNKAPFYYICGGAQDNGSMCGPSRSNLRAGVRTSDWFTSGGGDGFFNLIDPEDGNYHYSSSQDGAIQRLDLRTGQSRGIRPAATSPNPYNHPRSDAPAATAPAAAANPPATPPAGGAGAAGGGGAGGRQGGGGGRGGGGGGDRTNWDTPYIISPHAATRLYWGSNYLYRTDDRGDSWIRISPDLTRNLDYRTIPIMGKVWDPQNTVAYHNATTTLSDIVSIDESPLLEGLIYVGTDDGNLQTTEDGGKTWRKTTQFANGQDGLYLSDVFASPKDVNVMFVTQNNWQRGDYKPYIWRSDDKGKTFKSIAGDMPANHPVWSIIQDHVNPNLIFAGTEWGLFFTVDGGSHWTKMTGGLPAAVQVRDMKVQMREDDLVLGTFGRGFFVLDDYSPLRELTPEALSREAELFPMRHAYAYDELGYYSSVTGNVATPNPPSGAVFTYNVGPNFSGNLVLTVTNSTGRPLCRIDVPETPGLKRIEWALRVGDPAGAGGGRGGGGGGGGRGGGAPSAVPEMACIPLPGASIDPVASAQGGGAGGRGGNAGGGFVAAGRYVGWLGKLNGDTVTPVGKMQAFVVSPLPAKNW